MSIPKDLEAKRNKLMKKIDSDPSDSCESEVFSSGFDSGVQAALESEAVTKLVEALESIAKETGTPYAREATEALNAFKTWRGE